MVKNTGREYEEFVRSIYQAIIQSEFLGLSNQKNIEVEINKKLIGRDGLERQFDIYWEYVLAGHSYKTVIECKDYNSKISVDKIDAFIGKLNEFPNLRGLYATNKGYQTGANIKAEQHNIDLLIVREQNDTDWEDENGDPLIKQVNIGITAIFPARITGFNILIPKEADPYDPKSMSGMNNEIIITNEDMNEQYSLYDLQHKLVDSHTEGYGKFEKEFLFKGKVANGEFVFDIVGYKVKYEILKPSTENMLIDFSTKLLGVVEYLHQGSKSLVFDDHIKKR
ncbi:TPA: restriction endonuclease [Acinetobacter baumannii]|uniref:restriction endonuclease n=1 Tax=Acinetobacter baumannii TaxID=470 RepID=UPI0010222DD0|nr:restriction endonuclease [Acinetobacter baumannii]NDX83306.1 restriction endonuclease [Acinetobacter baumannii]NHR90769.1 restriction endonuclease [Acinetobacter baumannii]QBC46822.1 restriction endonuclease [Acinetobacter baumannii]QJG77284.1 restriction endonuclease [Acinetobacter baumannii]HBI8929801.1 restriction endonuclease [Acinetobacter baumannii]